MKNNITEHGLDLIANHLSTRIKGLKFPVEVSKIYYSLPQTNSYSMYDIQTLAERIAVHMVMVGYIPIIQLEDLPETVAGQINLNDSKYVYIKLDKQRFVEHKYAPVELVAIIAHELSHKFLWIHGFKDTSSKIEYVTDACAVYVGFGDYLYEASDRDVSEFLPDGTIRTVNHRLGYLEKWQVAYLRNKFFNMDLPYKYYKERAASVSTEESKSTTSYWEGFLILLIVAMVIFIILAYIFG